MSEFSDYLSKLMESHQKTPTDLARAMNLKHSAAVHRMLAGQLKATPERCQQIADFFQLEKTPLERIFQLALEDSLSEGWREHRALLLNEKSTITINQSNKDAITSIQFPVRLGTRVVEVSVVGQINKITVEGKP